tara:strand:- start:540 stop:1604 length:1065 start_codon:yes stop_codon:yes gene_type:complete
MRTRKKFFTALIITLMVGSQPVIAETDTANTPAHGMMNPMMMNGMTGMNPMMGMMNPGMMGMMNPGMMGMMNPMMMNGMTSMNPMMGMMNPMMGMMNPMMGMMNPMMMGMNPMMGMMTNPAIDGMTRAESLDSMMRMMDPKVMAAMMGGTYEQREDDDLPNTLPLAKIPGFPTQAFKNHPDNTVSPSISDEAKKNAFQSMMMMSPLSMRDMLSIITHKLPLEEGVTWDDAVDSMKLRANEVNFKFVGSSPLSKEIEALTGEPSPRIEIFRFCDALVARKILDYMPEFIVFLPCKIALIEDAEGKIWIMTMDWDVSWLDFAQNPNSHMSKELRADAKLIRENIRYIMEGAASGDL